MFGSLRKLGLWFDGPGGVHPDFAELLAYHDGGLGSRRTAWVAKHLTCCAECGAEVDGIGLGLRSCANALEEPGPVPPAAEGMERLMRVIRDETQLRAEQERLRNERNSRIVAELTTYFGSYPAFLLKTSAREDPAFRQEMDRLAQSFLGKSAAAALLHRIDFEVGVA